MNEMMHMCRSIVNSEHAINRLGNRVFDIAKYCRKTSTRVTFLAIAGLLTMTAIAMHDKEIEALKKQVAELKAAKAEAEDEASTTTEEQKDQEGA